MSDIKTQWPKIREMQDVTGRQDPRYVDGFIRLLTRRKLLHEHILSAIAASGSRQSEAWIALHDYAASVIKQEERILRNEHSINRPSNDPKTSSPDR